MELLVHKVQQAASGGSHVTIYEAEVDLIPGGSGVEVQGIRPDDGAPGAAELAASAIRRGAERALRPHGLGAVIRVTRVVLHPVDFKPSKFEQYTAQELGRLLPPMTEAEWLAAADSLRMLAFLCTRGLKTLEALAGETAGTFLVGDSPTFADIFLIPQLYGARRFSVDLAPFPTLTRIETACAALPAFHAAHADQQADRPAAG